MTRDSNPACCETEDSNPTPSRIEFSESFLDKMISNLKKLDPILIPTAGGVLAWLVIILLCGMASIVLFATQCLSKPVPNYPCTFLSIIGVGSLIAWSSFMSGALLGFIFGIPRILPQESCLVVSNKSENTVTEEKPNSSISSNPYDTTTGEKTLKGELYGENSNVDQISDWLTKILVGAGLTQLTHVPEALQQYSESVKSALGNFQSSGVFGTAILIFFLVDGFLIGYLWTRRSAAAELIKARYNK